MRRLSPSSSSEEVYWERDWKRERGGNETRKNVKDTSQSDLAQHESETKVMSKKTAPKRGRETHKAQKVDHYYQINKMDSLDTLARKKEEKHKEKMREQELKQERKLEHKQERQQERQQEQPSKEKKKHRDEPPTLYPDYDELKDPTDGSEENIALIDNFMIYIIMGYITGMILMLLWYLLFYNNIGTDIDMKWFLIVLLVLLVLLLCYNHTTRCIGALLLTIFFGYRGRILIMGWAFYLALYGPVMNIVNNVEIMIRSLACGQGLLSNALMPMHQIMGEPVYMVEQSVYNCLSQVRKLMQPLNDILQQLEAPIVELYSDYKICGEWLRHQQNFFENQMGTPYDRCMGAGSISVQECREKFSDDKSVCDIEKRFDWFCSNLKDLSSFFGSYTQQHQKIAEQFFTRPLESFDKIRSIFVASITFDHAQQADENNDKFINDIDLEIGKAWDFEINRFMIPFTWLYIVIAVQILIVILDAIYFRASYLGSGNFHNFYLTKQFHEYNVQQNANLGYSALPLRTTEKHKFVELFSFRYLPVEVGILYNHMLFLIITSLQLFIICFVDLSLFWMLAIMSYHSHQTAEVQPPEYTKILVEDGGMIGFILRGLVKAFEPISKHLFLDIQHCLPLPGPPMYMRYWVILMICSLAWLLMLLEPFFLRLRHLIMSHFYPENAKLRAQYLYERLLRDRELFILAERRKARATNLYAVDSLFLQFLRRFTAFLYWISCGSLGSHKGLKCIICKAKSTIKDCVECETPNCRGVYCQTCFVESNCHCILCNPPTVYGDYATYSEVDDSSNDSDPGVYPYRPHRMYCGLTEPERDKTV